MELNLPAVLEALAAELGDRPCLLFRDRVLTWREMDERTNRLANVLLANGIGRRRRRPRGWESPHDHVGLYLLNGNEYLEGMVGASKARAAAFNVNYRYVADELAYLLDDADAAASSTTAGTPRRSPRSSPACGAAAAAAGRRRLRRRAPAGCPRLRTGADGGLGGPPRPRLVARRLPGMRCRRPSLPAIRSCSLVHVIPSHHRGPSSRGWLMR